MERKFYPGFGFRHSHTGLPGLCLPPDPAGGGDAGAGGGAGGAGGDSGAGGDGGEGGAGGSQTSAQLEARARDAQRERDAARRALKEAQAEQQRISDRLAQLEKEASDRLHSEELAKKQKEEERLKAEGDFNKAKELLQQEADGKIKAAEAKARDSANRRVKSDVAAAVARIEGVVTGAVSEITNLIMSNVGLDDNFEPFVKAEDGRPRKKADDPTKLLTIDEFAAEYVKARPYFLRDSTPPGTGAKGGSDGASGGATWDIEKALKDPAYMAEWKSKDAAGYKKAWEEYRAKAYARHGKK